MTARVYRRMRRRASRHAGAAKMALWLEAHSVTRRTEEAGAYGDRFWTYHAELYARQAGYHAGRCMALRLAASGDAPPPGDA